MEMVIFSLDWKEIKISGLLKDQLIDIPHYWQHWHSWQRWFITYCLALKAKMRKDV